ncbi:hypothetical protein Taro_043011, partial [Colocasia esculenta]|nr:hypothetical protein [Colocasia esculenta]
IAGQGNTSIGQGTKSSILTSSSSHKKITLSNISVVPYNGRHTYVEGRRLGSVVAQGSVRHNGVQMDCRENREMNFSIQFDGQQIHVEERRFGGLATQGNSQV